MLLQLRKYELAISIFANCLRVEVAETLYKIARSYHGRVADAWVRIGNILASLVGRLDEAAVAYEEARRVQKHLNGPKHTSVTQILFKIGSLYSKQHKLLKPKAC